MSYPDNSVNIGYRVLDTGDDTISIEKSRTSPAPGFCKPAIMIYKDYRLKIQSIE